jgi:virginiamycin B lyase
MGTVSGTVEAPGAFKAAQVNLRNADRQMLYTVFTSAGAFRAVALFPGTYEIDAQARGFKSEVRKITVAAGDNPGVKLSMQAAADHLPSAVPIKVPTLASYDEIYPPGPGKEIAEQVCMVCHGENFLPSKPAGETEWRRRIDYMLGKPLFDNDKVGLGAGLLAPPAQNFRFGVEDRKALIAYLVKNFGPDKKPRAVRTTQQMPMDESVLGNAQFIEYYLKEEKPAAREGAAGGPDTEDARTPQRSGSLIQLDAKGNAWTVDLGIPNRLVKLDPRTGEQKDYPVPVPDAGVHDLLVDREGMVWLGNFTLNPRMTKKPMVFMFDIEKETFRQFDPDPKDELRTGFKSGMIGTAVDSKGNVYFNWMMSGGLSKIDRKTGEVTVFRLPTGNAVPYGASADKNDNIWLAEWGAGKIAKFDTTTNQWTEYTPPTYPANFRRGPSPDSKNNVWFGIWNAGKRPAKIVKLDQATGRMTEWSYPADGINPYEATADREDNIWVPSTWDQADQPSSIVRFNPRDQSFRFYPRPQVGSSTNKLVHAEDGSVWYPSRSRPNPGFGVLYPDKNKIVTLASPALNGPPGYPYKLPGAPARTAQGR